jgi:hypothetical protein
LASALDRPVALIWVVPAEFVRAKCPFGRYLNDLGYGEGNAQGDRREYSIIGAADRFDADRRRIEGRHENAALLNSATATFRARKSCSQSWRFEWRRRSFRTRRSDLSDRKSPGDRFGF